MSHVQVVAVRIKNLEANLECQDRDAVVSRPTVFLDIDDQSTRRYRVRALTYPTMISDSEAQRLLLALIEIIQKRKVPEVNAKNSVELEPREWF